MFLPLLPDVNMGGIVEVGFSSSIGSLGPVFLKIGTKSFFFSRGSHLLGAGYSGDSCYLAGLLFRTSKLFLFLLLKEGGPDVNAGGASSVFFTFGLGAEAGSSSPSFGSI